MLWDDALSPASPATGEDNASSKADDVASPLAAHDLLFLVDHRSRGTPSATPRSVATVNTAEESPSRSQFFSTPESARRKQHPFNLCSPTHNGYWPDHGGYKSPARAARGGPPKPADCPQRRRQRTWAEYVELEDNYCAPPTRLSPSKQLGSCTPCPFLAVAPEPPNRSRKSQQDSQSDQTPQSARSGRPQSAISGASEREKVGSQEETSPTSPTAKTPRPLLIGCVRRAVNDGREVWAQLADERKQYHRERQQILRGMGQIPFEKWYKNKMKEERQAKKAATPENTLPEDSTDQQRVAHELKLGGFKGLLVKRSVTTRSLGSQKMGHSMSVTKKYTSERSHDSQTKPSSPRHTNPRPKLASMSTRDSSRLGM